MPKCKICADKFVPSYNSLTQKTCVKPECLAAWGKVIAAKEKAKHENKEKSEFRQWKKQAEERLMTLSDYIQICQKVFNTFIRMRDKNQPCISSGRPLKGKYDAGHFFSTGAYPNLRFHEDNVHGQSVHDNRDLHGNLIAYREGLIQRIGIERFEALEKLKHQERKYTIPEVKELIVEYRKKIKELSK